MLPVLLPRVELEVVDRDVVVNEDEEGNVPGTNEKLLMFFFLAIVTENFSLLQNGHVESFSFWGRTCRKHSVHIIAPQQVVMLTAPYDRKHIGHSSIVPPQLLLS